MHECFIIGRCSANHSWHEREEVIDVSRYTHCHERLTEYHMIRKVDRYFPHESERYDAKNLEEWAPVEMAGRGPYVRRCWNRPEQYQQTCGDIKP
jgi:aspartyl/asparaginyl beta-hydroxylase (cupin superfamily)